MSHSHSPGLTGFWIFSMHVPSKMEVWQVSMCFLQASALTGRTPTSQCCLHQLLSLSSHLETDQFLTHSSPKSLSLQCHPPGTHLSHQNVTLKTRFNSPSYRMALLPLPPRGDLSFLYQISLLENDSENGTQFSLLKAVCSVQMKWDHLLCGSWGERRRKSWLALPVRGQQRVSECLRRKEIWWACPSLYSFLLINSFIYFKIQLKCHFPQKYQVEVMTFPFPPTIFSNHECNHDIFPTFGGALEGRATSNSLQWCPPQDWAESCHYQYWLIGWSDGNVEWRENGWDDRSDGCRDVGKWLGG